MIGRTVGGVTYSLAGVCPERSRRDAENRLQQVKQGSTVLASYTVRQAQGRPYDADGNRVTAVIGSSTTVYIGAYYEKTTSGSSTTITKYYQAGGQRVAMRVNGVVRWLASDHPSTVLRTGLGSTSITANEAGARMAAPTPPTEFPLSAGAAGSLVTRHRRGRRRRRKITSGQLVGG